MKAAKTPTKFDIECAKYKKALTIGRVAGRVRELAEAMKDREEAWFILGCKKHLVRCIGAANNA